MKKIIIKKCMNYIKKNTDYDEIKLAEIEYGLISIYLTFSKIIIILILSILFDLFEEVIIYMVLFNILRTTGFGLHANKSWTCLLSSTISFIGIPILCKYLYINVFIKLFICLIGVFFMFKNAPADTKKKPIVNKKRRLTFKILSTILAIVYSVSAITINNNFLSNCLVFALLLENIMISPITYKLFKMPYNNYITFLKEHPDFSN